MIHVASLGFSIYSIMSLTNKAILPLPSSLDNFSFSCLIAVACTSNNYVEPEVVRWTPVLDFSKGFQLFTVAYYISDVYVIMSFIKEAS